MGCHHGTAFEAVRVQRAGKQRGTAPLSCLRHQQSQHVWSGTIHFVEKTTEIPSLEKDSPMLSLWSSPEVISRKASERGWCLPLSWEGWANGKMRRRQPPGFGDPTGAPLSGLWSSLVWPHGDKGVSSHHHYHLGEECPRRSRAWGRHGAMHGQAEAHFTAVQHFLFSVDLGSSGLGFLNGTVQLLHVVYCYLVFNNPFFRTARGSFLRFSKEKQSVEIQFSKHKPPFCSLSQKAQGKMLWKAEGQSHRR